jgi:branched-chain amino acid transport system permease protein
VAWGIFLFILLAFSIFIKDQYWLDIIITTVLMAAMAGAWNIVGGYAGLLSLGHATFFGIGSYTSTLLFLKMGVSPWFGMFFGAAFSMIAAYIIGILTIRLKGPFFALVTLALSQILEIVTIKFGSFTGGSNGLNIPFQPKWQNMIFQNYQIYLVLFIVLLAAVIFTSIYIENSRFGSNLIAIRENEQAATSLGVNAFQNKLRALLLSSFFTSLGGSLYAQYILFIDPTTSFSINYSTKFVILTIIGGMGTIIGPILGGIILTPFEIFVRAWLGSTFQGAYLLIYGIILIIVILLVPEGIVVKVKRLIGRRKFH